MILDAAALSPGELAGMAAAGENLVRLEAEMRAAGASPAVLLTGGATPEAFRHYPDGDCYDICSHSQFYYHVHRAGEHGHIHLFMRPAGMPVGCRPLVSGGSADAPCHLLAVGLGADGFANELFTTNRWVTDEAWYHAGAVARMLPCFQVAPVHGGTVGEWLTALVALVRPLAVLLAERRDAAMAGWSLKHPGDDPLAALDLEIPSRVPFLVSAWRSQVMAALEGALK